MRSKVDNKKNVDKIEETFGKISIEKQLKITTLSDQPWPDIFLTSRVALCINPSNFENPEIMVRFALDEFYKTFGYEKPKNNEFRLQTLFGPATDNETINKIHISMLSERGLCEYINLYRSNGVVLSCHVTLVSLSHVHEDDNPIVFDINAQNDSKFEKWGTMTFRSASCVGNSKFLGIGMLGLERIKPEVIRNLVEESSSIRKKI